MALPYQTRGVETLFLAHDPFFVDVPKGHPITARNRITSAELDPDELLLLEEGHCLRDHALSACELRQSPIRRALEATSLHTLVQMVNFGLGITLLPKFAVDGGILTGTNIEIRPLAGRDVSRQIGLIWRQGSVREQEFRLLGKSLVASLE